MDPVLEVYEFGELNRSDLKVSAGNLWFLSLRFTTGDILGWLLLISDIFGGGRNTFRGGFLLLLAHFSRLKKNCIMVILIYRLTWLLWREKNHFRDNYLHRVMYQFLMDLDFNLFFLLGLIWKVQLECIHFGFISEIHPNTEIRDQNLSPSKVVT